MGVPTPRTTPRGREGHEFLRLPSIGARGGGKMLRLGSNGRGANGSPSHKSTTNKGPMQRHPLTGEQISTSSRTLGGNLNILDEAAAHEYNLMFGEHRKKMRRIVSLRKFYACVRVVCMLKRELRRVREALRRSRVAAKQSKIYAARAARRKALEEEDAKSRKLQEKRGPKGPRPKPWLKYNRLITDVFAELDLADEYQLSVDEMSSEIHASMQKLLAEANELSDVVRAIQEVVAEQAREESAIGQFFDAAVTTPQVGGNVKTSLIKAASMAKMVTDSASAKWLHAIEKMAPLSEKVMAAEARALEVAEAEEAEERAALEAEDARCEG
eukprot:CAMPEP_0182853688 /NCGR_PEP_ID=MMETSP0034_2-20130328/831_1 /TAXON_ID=156128 /ORGANISM="Nephroselmis pyriformis, Strain CCMP717" /LENGTH=327 /DNA_ID=CAMNT_0024984469 /DNA_START=320 /DNA_END=1299 /DNA_ORIENTATION=-